MALLRSLTWILVLIAASFAGPNVPAQGLTAIREASRTLVRRLFVLR